MLPLPAPSLPQELEVKGTVGGSHVCLHCHLCVCMESSFSLEGLFLILVHSCVQLLHLCVSVEPYLLSVSCKAS